MMETVMVRSTSCTEARITTVRSTATCKLRAGETDARSHGRVAFTRSAVSIMLAPGWRNTPIITPGFPPDSPRLRMSATESITLATSARRTGVAGDDQRLVLGRLEQLVGVGEHPGTIGIREGTFGLIGVGRLQCLANGFEADPVAVQLLGIHLHTYRRARGTPGKHLADTFHLCDLLGQDGVRRIVNLADRNGVRG